MEELGEIVTRRQKLSVTDEVELSEEMWLEELEETPSDPGELEDLICDPMEVPPTISHHFSILHVLDLSYTEIKSLPQSISRLVALQKLFLRSCEHLMELPPEIGELTNLEVLDLEGTQILCLPKEIAKLVNLTCLKVSFYGYASQTVQKVIPRRVLSNLSRLIELIIDVSPYGEWWDVEVEAIIDDLRSLKQLETLKLYLPTTILLEELKCMFPGLPNFRFTVGHHEEHFISRLPHDVEEEFNNLEKGLKYMNGSHIPNEITKVFKPNAFFLQRHWTAKSLSDFGHENINEVKFCLVMECNEFRTIIDSEQFYQGKDAIVLGSLERLIIRYLKNVESIWKGPVGKGSLSNLKSLVVFTCPNLTTLLTIDMLGNLSNLEELIVEDCPKIESVVSLKSSGSKSDLFLPSLKKISLIDVPELVSISGGLWIAPKLERLVILYCPKLEKLCTTEVSSTELKVIKGEKEWWDALKWYESDLSTEHGDYLARLFIPLRRDDEISGYGQGKVGSFNIRDPPLSFSEEEHLEEISLEELEETPSNPREILGSVKDQYLRSSMASSSNSEFEVIYDIFLSFRGLDTRHRFIDHLYKALKQEGFETFRDDDEIERGEDFKSELRKAIWNSRLSVVVLSKNYANSTACLFEIQTILEHRKKLDHLILPVFYEVEPREIKEQARNLNFGKKKVTVKEVEGWRAALEMVAGMAGMVFKHQSSRYDATFIEEIVGIVKIRLSGERMRVADHQELEKNMQNLKIELEYLIGQKNDINVEISSAESQSWKRRKKEVEVWLSNVQRLKDDEQRLEKEVVGEGKVFPRAQLGKHILEKIHEVQELQERGRVFNGLLVDELPIGRLLIPPTKDFVDSTKARNQENVWECLMDEDFRKIGVCGMGGVGKTTIMKQIHNLLLEEKGKFDSVFWVTVSIPFNIRMLQRDIGKVLNLSLSDVEDEKRRASQLYAVLSRLKRYVLILDDLWEAFSLESVGIPEPTRSNGCKLVLTTRSLEVCRRMECKVVKVELLSKQEASTLFLSKAVGHDKMLAPEVEEIATKVAEECGCLPLAIVTVAGSMRGLRGKHDWRNALNELINSKKDAIDGEIEVFEQLELSYSRLGHKVLQDCFLYCSLYPENHDIPVKELIEYWIAEGFIPDLDSVEAKFEKGHLILHKLTSTSLLERFTVNCQDCVRVHDLIRDMALRITQSSPRFMVNSGVYLESVPDEEWSEDLERISLMYCFMVELPKRPPNCPRLTTLLLKCNRLSEIPDSFFTYLRGLEVLDLSYNMIKSLPESISNLENLHAIILAECNNIEYVPSLEKMKALKVFKLTQSRIKEAPNGIEELVNLRELDLSDNRILETFPSSMLHRLSKLQCLRVKGTPVEVSAKDLVCLRQLKIVTIQLHNIAELNMCVRSQWFKGLEKYFLAVGERIWLDSDEGNGVFINSESEPYRSGVDQVVLPNSITSLELCGFHDLISLSAIPCVKDARHVRRFEVKDCYGLESIFLSSSFSEDGLISLSTVESFHLSDLRSFRVLFDGIVPPCNISFNLKILCLKRCDSVKNIFPAQLLQNFPNLEELTVGRCENVEDIIVGEEEMSDSNTITLPRLRVLRLFSLPRLKSIYTGIIVCESVQRISVCGCPMVGRLPLSLHMNNDQATAPPALAYILGEEEWWESLGWDDPLTKTILEPVFQPTDVLRKMLVEMGLLDEKGKRKAMK